MRRLGILLTRSPEQGEFSLALRLARTALKKGVDVQLFLMGEGVYGLLHSEIQKLAAEGVRIMVCRYSAERKGIPRDFYGNVDSGSQYDLSHMVAQCDRFIPLT